ncbi:NAD(P)H-dependent oxidoreductase [Sphingomonas sp. 179-I 2A4 NHS]|jgi:NAD(P)H dehydrogenase (quinone)|uniref:NAD(P)H-dependent oxidoreductase n=1 Tax=unclassified Sphingomonas TaxID=196159 RepID=UPI00387A5F01
MSDAARPRHIVILCHPEQDSFNASVADRYSRTVRSEGHEVFVRDLYAMGFDPVLRNLEQPGPTFKQFRDIQDELDIIRGADVFVMVYPLWFGTPPAMLKGYIDRVLGSGVIPAAVQDRTAQGVLTGKQMVSFTSSAANEVWLDVQGMLSSLETIFDRYISHAFRMLPPRHFHYGLITPDIDELTVQRHLGDVEMHARRVVQELADRRAAATA